MTTGGRIAAFVGKWVLVPVALGLVGYYVVGPQIGKSPGFQRAMPFKQAAAPKPTSESVAIQPVDVPRSALAVPDVEVTSEPVPKRRPPTRRRERREVAPTEEPALPNIEDPASAGGMDEVPGAPPESDPASGGGADG